jgi:SAM-dependent methyltransferase
VIILSSKLLRALRRFGRRGGQQPKSTKGDGPRRQYRRGYYADKEDIAERWDDIGRVADLRPTDTVLDMGCAEGLISLEVAKHVSHVDGIEISAHLLEQAVARSREQRIENVSFAVGSVIESTVPPNSYDVVLFLGVMGKRAGDRRVGLEELECMLAATRRQIVVRVNVQKRAYMRDEDDFRLHDVLTMMDLHGFDAVCFEKREGQGNLVVGNRRGTDARLRAALPLVVIPTEMMSDHPCLGGVPIAVSTNADKVASR